MNPSVDSTEEELFVDPTDDQPLVPKRSLDDSEMDITPMIDITFLLLIFFLVAGRLEQTAPVELPPARHGTAVTTKSSVVVTIAEGPDRQAVVYLGDGKVPERLLEGSDLAGQETAIERYVNEELQNGSEPKTNIVIKAERNVRHRDVARISAAAARGGGDLYVAVTELP